MKIEYARRKGTCSDAGVFYVLSTTEVLIGCLSPFVDTFGIFVRVEWTVYFLTYSKVFI